MMDLHGPVPHYAEDLHASMGRVFASLRKPLWRANFAVAEWSEEEDEFAFQLALKRQALVLRIMLCSGKRQEQPTRTFRARHHIRTIAEWEEPSMTPEAILARVFLKVEYETLRRLPINSEYLVFTIRSHIDPLPDRTPELLAYKGLGQPEVRAVVLSYLDSASAASEGSLNAGA
eukprot:s118_g13.t1